ncbi:hypothetical protein FRC17_009700 [Serendipita sp. 399]|nr:hypothetical protein FRC17_009700 [Serendipita sp. 399]
METFEVGISFEDLDVLKPLPLVKMFNPAISHWVLVFKTKSPSIKSYCYELKNADGKIESVETERNHDVIAFPFATYVGKPGDLYQLSKQHPHNGTAYDLHENNCHHWAGRFLYLLEEYARTTRFREFSKTSHWAFTNIMSVIDKELQNRSVKFYSQGGAIRAHELAGMERVMDNNLSVMKENHTIISETNRAMATSSNPIVGASHFVEGTVQVMSNNVRLMARNTSEMAKISHAIASDVAEISRDFGIFGLPAFISSTIVKKGLELGGAVDSNRRRRRRGDDE